MIQQPESDEEDELEALNAFLQQKAEAFNRTPNSEIGGFSPDMLFRLMHSEWNTEGCPLSFNTELSLEELSDARLYVGMRAILEKAVGENGLKATAGGNLSRNVVAELVDAFWSTEEKEQYFQISKKMDEEDVFPLHAARLVLEATGLLKRRKGAFTVPKTKHKLLMPEQAGTLAARLFTTYFTRFNLGYLSRFPDDVLEIQRDAGFVLFTLGKQARDWLSVDEAPRKLLHPHTLNHLEAISDACSYDTPEVALRHLLLQPMERWGLIQVEEEKKHLYFKEWRAIRITPFYERWVRFG